MTAEQVGINAQCVLAAAARLEHAGYEGDAAAFVEGLLLEAIRKEFVREGVVHGNPRVPVRIWRKLRVDEGGCWLWTGTLDKTGYGRTVRLDRQGTIAVHRLTYQQLVGPIPDGLDLDHLCRTRACSNPNHLEAVTRQINILRGRTVPARNAAKTECKYGHPFSGSNLRIKPDGRRACRACDTRYNQEVRDRVGIDEFRRIARERSRKYAARKKAAS